jgi:ribosomal-protein-alanine N-acetyltransferase
MTLADIPAVLEIDQLSFPTPSRALLYEYELRENDLAHYFVLARQQDGGHQMAQEEVVGHVGYWLMAGEAHISTIAVLPACRGRGLGDVLLLQVLLDAYEMQAELVTLEVRRSNVVAQRLYTKYRFEMVGERPRYYRDTGEDALLMTVMLDEEYRGWLEEMVGRVEIGD